MNTTNGYSGCSTYSNVWKILTGQYYINKNQNIITSSTYHKARLSIIKNTTWENHNYETPVNGAQTWPKAIQSTFTIAKPNPIIINPKTDSVTIKPRHETNLGLDIKYNKGNTSKLLICETHYTSVKIV